MDLWRRRGRILRRAGWGFGDQALSSITNFALLVLVARSVTPTDLGIFALFLAGYTTLAYFNESLTGDPLIVRYGGSTRDTWKAGVDHATGCSLSLSAGVAIVLVGLSFILHGVAGNLVLIGAVCVPGLLLQDTMRFAFFAGARPQQAVLSDGIWAVLQLGGVLAVISLHRASVTVLVGTWAGAGAVAGFIALLQARALPRPLRSKRWLRDQRDLSGYILIERLTGQGALHMTLILIGVFAGLPAAGAVRAALALYGPLNVATNGARIVLVPELVRISRKRIRRTVGLAAAAGALLAFAIGLITIFLPAGLGRALLGQTWALATPLFAFIAVDRIANTATEAWRLGLLSLASVKRSLAVRLPVSGVAILGAAIGSVAGGARGAVFAGAVVSAVGALLWRQQFVLASYQDTAGTGHLGQISGEPTASLVQ